MNRAAISFPNSCLGTSVCETPVSRGPETGVSAASVPKQEFGNESKLFDFFANCEYFEEEFNYDEVRDLPPRPTGSGEEPGGAGGGPGPIPGAYEHLGADIIASMKQEAVGPQGMKIDRMLFQKFEETVKPEEYYTLDKLRRAAAVDRRLTLR